jgi:tyrosyl-tRNA synthetase
MLSHTDDRDVVKYLKYFTFLSHEEILELEKQVAEAPEKLHEIRM